MCLSQNVELISMSNQVYDAERVFIIVNNQDENTQYRWNTSKFKNRYWLIKDIADTYFSTGQIPVLNRQEDPFWDPPEA